MSDKTTKPPRALTPEEQARLDAGYPVLPEGKTMGERTASKAKKAAKKIKPKEEVVPLPPAPAGAPGGPPKVPVTIVAGVGAAPPPIDMGMDPANLPKPWTFKQYQFVLEYLTDPKRNGTQAAIRAGYSVKTAAVIAHENLNRPHIQAFVAERLRKLADHLGLTAAWVLDEIHAIAAFNMLDYISVFSDGHAVTDLSAMTRRQAAALRSIEVTEMQSVMVIEAGIEIPREVTKVKITGQDKLKGLELLGKHYGLLEERIEITHRADPTDLDLARYMAFMLSKAGKAISPPALPAPAPSTS